LKDFSISGAFIATDFTLPILANITLMIFDARSSPRHPRAIHGYVVRQCEGAIAIGWWNLAPVTVTHLISLSGAMTPVRRVDPAYVRPRTDAHSGSSDTAENRRYT
jgi:hypothetical protein